MTLDLKQAQKKQSQAKEKAICHEQGYHDGLRGDNSDGVNQYRAHWKRAAYLEGFNAGVAQRHKAAARHVAIDKSGIKKIAEIIQQSGLSEK